METDFLTPTDILGYSYKNVICYASKYFDSLIVFYKMTMTIVGILQVCIVSPLHTL